MPSYLPQSVEELSVKQLLREMRSLLEMKSISASNRWPQVSMSTTLARRSTTWKLTVVLLRKKLRERHSLSSRDSRDRIYPKRRSSTTTTSRVRMKNFLRWFLRRAE